MPQRRLNWLSEPLKWMINNEKFNVMKNKNTGYLFTKAYFKLDRTPRNYQTETNNENEEEKLVINNLSDRSQKILEENLSPNNDLTETFETNKGFRTFELTTVYPGLLAGSGYMHDIKSKEAFKLGFFFDHTTGLPVIPGSSVKGVLRDAFEKAGGKYVEELLGDLGVSNNTFFEKLKIDSVKKPVSVLVAHIFHGCQIKSKTNNDGKTEYFCEPLPIYHRDKFFDAFPVATAEQKFLADDYITPHPDPLKNPVPLRFLKVRPGVTFRFVFELHDFKNENGDIILTAGQKLELFKKILLDLGVGAKTNVGYGQFKDYSENDSENVETKTSPRLNEGKTIENIQSGDVLEARIINLKGGIQIDTEIPGMDFSQRLIGVSPKNFTLGQVIKVKVVINEKKGKKYYKFENIDE